MNDKITADETQEIVPAAPPPDVVKLVSGLIALITDPKSSEDRLKKIVVAHADLTKRQKIFVAAQTAHAATVAKDLQKVEAAREAVGKRELKAAEVDARLKCREELLANPPRRTRVEELPGGMVREFVTETPDPLVDTYGHATTEDQSKLPMPKRQRPHSRRPSRERFGVSTLTRDAG